MAKYLIEESTLKGLADALRKVTGETRTYTPTEMIDAVSTILETGIYLLVDENGNEIPAVFAEEGTVFTATANDIRLGFVAATESGVTTGEKDIPAYHTTEGIKYVPVGSKCTIELPTDERYEYTKLQVIVCLFNTTLPDSVAAEKVCIDDLVYNVGSTVSISSASADSANKAITLGITNTGSKPYVMRYFTYKEEY